MSKTFLSWLGLAFLLGLCGAAVAGLVLVKDRIQVVVQAEGAAGADAQRLAQLKDDLQQVQRDVRALADALGNGLRQLADEQSADADKRQAELERHLASAEATRVLTGELAAVRAEQQRVARTLADLHEGLRQDRPARSMAVAAAPPATGEGAIESAPPTPAVTAADGSPAARTSPSPVVAEPSPAPRKRSAFAFQLPSQGFTFDLAQRFELLPSLSRVGFDAKSTLHDFSGVTSQLSGSLMLNLAAPAAGCSGEIRVDAASLDTGLAGRNEAMREHLDCMRHQEIVFAPAGLTDATVDRDKQLVSGNVQGRLTIRGQTRDVIMPVRLSVDDSRRVHAAGEMKLKLSDYGVPVPSQLGMIKMQDEVKVWIALQARALGAEKPR